MLIEYNLMYTIIPYTIKSISINNRKKRKIPYVIIQTMKCNKVPINMYKATTGNPDVGANPPI